MARKHPLLLTGLITISALGTLALLLTAPSWSSSALLSVTTTAPENLPEAGTSLTLRGSGFSQTTQLWLAPERSLRSATTTTLETYGNPHHFIHRDDHFYVANGFGGFFIVQGVQSSAPRISGSLDSEGQALEVALRRDEALLAAGVSGLQIIDIRDDAAPQLIAVLKSVAPALSVASSDKIAYVAAGNAGVQIVDLTDPLHPRRLGELANLPAAYKLSCDEALLIVATADGGWLYDIRQPEQPRRLAALPVPAGSNTVMTRQGEILYWATKSSQKNRLYAIDLSRPTSPRLLASIPLSGTPNGISSSEKQLAIALGSSGTQIFSLGNDPRLVAGTTITAKSRTRYSLPLGNDLWVADGGGELLRLDSQGAKALALPPLLPGFAPRIPPLVTTQHFLLGDRTGIAIYDRGDDNAPMLLARLPITDAAQQHLSADQRQLWVATHRDEPATTGKLIGIDLSQLHAPRVTAEIPFAYTPVIIGELGTTLIIAAATADQPHPLGIDSLHLIDISQPQNPVLYSTYPLAAVSVGQGMTEHGVLVMQMDGLLRVIDLNAEGVLQEMGALQMPWLHTAAWGGRVNIVVKDNVAFISSSLGKIFLVDLSDRRRPKNLGVFTLAGPVASLLINDHLLLAKVDKEGLAVIDLKNIQAPEILGIIPLPGRMHGITVQDELIWYVNVDSNGIWSLPLPRRLQGSVAGDQITASFTQPPPPGAYRLWLTDAQRHLLVPGVSWYNP